MFVFYGNFLSDFSVAGISRSVTIAGAYIMSVTNINHQEAFQAIRSARNAANPNIGFQRQLYEFEISGACDKVNLYHILILLITCFTKLYQLTSQ